MIFFASTLLLLSMPAAPASLAAKTPDYCQDVILTGDPTIDGECFNVEPPDPPFGPGGGSGGGNDPNGPGDGG